MKMEQKFNSIEEVNGIVSSLLCKITDKTQDLKIISLCTLLVGVVVRTTSKFDLPGELCIYNKETDEEAKLKDVLRDMISEVDGLECGSDDRLRTILRDFSNLFKDIDHRAHRAQENN